jgi:PhnB protein
MSQIAANPYINFQGHAREALEFYHQALGGEITLLSMASGSMQEAAPGDAIMHGAIMSDGLLIMGSDGHPDYPVTAGDNIAVALSGSDQERLTAAFDQLSTGGVVKQPLQQESWGDLHGYFTDEFGINWMVNISPSN